MSNKNHHGPHCAGLCEGQAYISRIKELKVENARLREHIYRIAEYQGDSDWRMMGVSIREAEVEARGEAP